ncbi:hypothetical protein [Planctomicrobium piriforme]|uniref:OstA-like protein n=1 Tax=Planctomicrobium piriforme TaxID=1576369 RepID=A0A1I3D1W9_9PLAN|nr:hypothetical protein [Planctomicrobium piriforme]SFH80702.1 hypothetical protein SAMN05421753_10358 [Planctomicrobium piriforme]
MSRFLITMTVMGCLLGASQVYSFMITPMTAVVASKGPELPPEETAIRPPAMFEQQAMEVFPDAEWTHTAEQTWQMAENVSLYFREHQRVPGSGNTIQISPVAIVWKDPKRPGAKPFRVLAQRAQIKFQNSFFDTAISLTDAKPGRIVWGSLEGAVHIDGPDGLQIDGQNFKFEEESLQLYSDYPIKFAYGPTPQDKRQLSGTANQIQLTFLPSSEALLGRDMPRIAGLAQVLLRRNVVLDTIFEQQGIPRAARLTSAGSLLYDAVKREATMDDQVRVTHRMNKLGKTLQDAIACEWLHLQFESTKPTAVVEEPSPKGAFEGLVFRSLRAQGSLAGKGTRLKVTSDEQDVTAVMQDLTYDAIQRRAVMVDQEQVVIQRGQATFLCPQIGVQHSATNSLEYLECRGPGQLEVLQEGLGTQPLMARWAARVQVSPDPEAKVHQIRIEQRAQLSVPDQFGVAADVLRLWVDLERVQSAQSGTGEPGKLLSKALPLKRARAEGRVQFDSSMIKVLRSDLIDAVITPGLLGEKSPAANSPLGNSGNSKEKEREQDPWTVEADELLLSLVHDSSVAAMDVRQVKGHGNIRIQHDPAEAMSMGPRKVDGPLVLTGVDLLAENAGGVQQTLIVRGEVDSNGQIQKRADISLGTTHLWGGQITFSRHENRVDVPGPGGLSVPIPRKQPAAVPMAPPILDIIWGEGMTFDGSAARFWGKITASLPSEQESISRLLCEDLTAKLNQRISFIDPQSRNGEINIESITGRHNVILEAYEYQQTKLSAVRRAEVAEFELQQSTGDFRGEGPGEIHSWTLGDQVRFTPGETPQANQPARSSPSNKWRYSSVKFSGKIDGNMNRNEARLNDRVEVITAPVDKPMVKFDRDKLSAKTPEAENAVWMKCHQLRIVRELLADQKTSSVEVFATGATELEGHAFHAYADELTYDESRGQFVLRGLGREATLYYQQEVGKPSTTSAARHIQFTPAKREIAINGSTGLNGSY